MSARTMTEDQQALYDKISNFTIDENEVDLSFAERLALENGWTPALAQAAIIEYKKFIFLAMEAEHAVTPSDQVDQVWHLHLTYTESYWERLCKDMLKRPLHHHPTLGGADEVRKFRDQYQKTLESYKAFFGKAAPKALWPKPSVRFRDGLGFVRVNTRRMWLVSKRRVLWKAVLVLLGLFLISAFIFRLKLGLATAEDGLEPIQSWLVENRLAIVMISALLLVFAVNIKWRLLGKSSSGQRGAGCGFDDGGGDGGGCGGGCGD